MVFLPYRNLQKSFLQKALSSEDGRYDAIAEMADILTEKAINGLLQYELNIIFAAASTHHYHIHHLVSTLLCFSIDCNQIQDPYWVHQLAVRHLYQIHGKTFTLNTLEHMLKYYIENEYQNRDL